MVSTTTTKIHLGLNVGGIAAKCCNLIIQQGFMGKYNCVVMVSSEGENISLYRISGSPLGTCRENSSSFLSPFWFVSFTAKRGKNN